MPIWYPPTSSVTFSRLPTVTGRMLPDDALDGRAGPQVRATRLSGVGVIVDHEITPDDHATAGIGARWFGAGGCRLGEGGGPDPVPGGPVVLDEGQPRDQGNFGVVVGGVGEEPDDGLVARHPQAGDGTFVGDPEVGRTR